MNEKISLGEILAYWQYKPICVWNNSSYHYIMGVKEVEHSASETNRKHNPLHNKVMTVEVLINLWHKKDLFWVDTFECKLALRPISDLVKEIEHNGKKVIPMLELAKILYDNPHLVFVEGYFTNCKSSVSVVYKDPKCTNFGNNTFSLSIGEKYIHRIDYNYMQYLFEWHFDVFGLIEKWLAVDRNKLDKGLLQLM